MIPLAIPATVARVLPYWKLAALGLLLALLAVQTLRLSYAERRADKAQFHLNEARQALKDLAEQSKRQIEETGKTVERVIYRDLPDAEKRARKVEGAKLPGNCRTPDAVMGADL